MSPLVSKMMKRRLLATGTMLLLWSLFSHSQDIVGLDPKTTERRLELPREQNGASLGMPLEEFFQSFPNSVERHRLVNLLFGRRLFEVAKQKLPPQVRLMRVLFEGGTVRSVGLCYAQGFVKNNPWREFSSKLVSIYGMPVQKDDRLVAWKDRECLMMITTDREQSPENYCLVVQLREHAWPEAAPQ